MRTKTFIIFAIVVPGEAMTGQDRIISARWIIPVVPEHAVLEQMALVIRDGRIHDLLPRTLAVGRYPDAERLDLPTHALLPGLVNAHTHAAMTLLRGLGADQSLNVWLEQFIWPLEKRWMDREFVKAGSRLAIAEMLLSGTTCFNDMYFFPDATLEAAELMGIRMMAGLPVIGFPTRWAESPADYLRRGLELRDRYTHNARVRFALAPHAVYSVDEATLKLLSTLASELDLPVHMHLHETRKEVEDSIRIRGMTPIAYLYHLGLLNARLIAVHLTAVGPDEIRQLADAGVSAVHCPESNLKLGSGIAPVERFRHAGIRVALGTDGAASNDDLDLLGEMRTAGLLAKGAGGDPTALPAGELIRMATLEGARALGLETEIGSLEVGKSADCIAIDLSAPATTPCHDPVAQIVYAATRNQVSHVWIAGTPRVVDGRLVPDELEDILSTARNWEDRLSRGVRGEEAV